MFNSVDARTIVCDWIFVGATIDVRTQIAEKTNMWMLNVNWNVCKRTNGWINSVAND